MILVANEKLKIFFFVDKKKIVRRCFSYLLALKNIFFIDKKIIMTDNNTVFSLARLCRCCV